MTFEIKPSLYSLIIGLFCLSCSANEQNRQITSSDTVAKDTSMNVHAAIITGAMDTAAYLPLLKGKNVGIVSNHTAMVESTHLVDFLVGLQVNVIRLFSPEHGFRGKADAGELVHSNIDAKTGLPITSLYGKNKKPTAEQLDKLDVILFDIQDVGVRFYTYISTMHYVMEACAENNVDFIVLDRPNPNGHYIDGPILLEKYRSFVGLHPVPIVHGMTIGEYAKMINGEKWLKNNVVCNLTVIKAQNYTHNTFYELPIPPSPNLPNMSSVYLYPSLCLFEGTPISIGRGTNTPFQVIGHPLIQSDKHTFTPQSMPGAKKPKLLGEKCFGYDLSTYGNIYMKTSGQLNLFWLINVYKDFPDKKDFFKPMFRLLSGTDQLEEQIKQSDTEEEIRATWKEGLDNFSLTRKKYLLYPDFK